MLELLLLNRQNSLLECRLLVVCLDANGISMVLAEVLRPLLLPGSAAAEITAGNKAVPKAQVYLCTLVKQPPPT